MRRRRVLTLCLLLMSLTAWPTLGQSTTSSTPEQIVSAIDPGMWYLGSDVQDALRQVIALGQEEIRTTAEEAVKTAVAPLLAENAQLTTERDGYRDNWKAAEADKVEVGIVASLVGILLGLGAAALLK